MSKRAIAALVAAALAMVGIVLLIGYANGANERAFNDAKLVEVLQVSEPIEADTEAGELKGKVETVELPRSAIAQGAIKSLSEVKGMATTTDLEPGEQVLLSRFSKEGEVEVSTAKGDVPKGMQELAIPLSSARAVSDVLKVGDKVGVVGSYQTKEGDGVTQMIRNQVVITKVTGPGVKWDGSPLEDITQIITVAVPIRDAGKIINALEFGKIYLTKQNKDTLNGQGGSISKEDVTQ
jgi:pilus assembly protein CpaB